MQVSDVNQSIANRLHSAAIHLLRRLRREDDASGLPAPQLSVVHRFLSSQSRAVAGLQSPPAHFSSPSHRLLSAQDVPSAVFAVAHPVCGLHVSVVHLLPSSQLRGFVPTHTPA